MQTTKTEQKNITACIIIIGNEILSGRTQDKNIGWLATQLNEIGVKIAEVRVIPDVHETIIATVDECRKKFTYIFTTGGIGPTHDDITSECIARVFGVAVSRDGEAEAILTNHYGAENLNPARLKMAEIPIGSRLILNPVSAAPGFIIENVYVMAGVPSIMQAMFAGIKGELKGGAKTLSKTISLYVTEGLLAEGLTAVQNKFADVEIGSYPFIRHTRLGTSLVCRSVDAARLDECYNALKSFLLTITPEIAETDLAA